MNRVNAKLPETGLMCFGAMCIISHKCEQAFILLQKVRETRNTENLNIEIIIVIPTIGLPPEIVCQK